MLDAAEFLDRYEHGDQTTTGNPTGGPWGERPTEIESEIPPRDYESYDYQGVAQNVVTQIRRAYEPEYWLIANSPTANTELAVYYGTDAAGMPVQRLYPGWTCRIPGRGTNLCIVQVGSGSADFHVDAVRGFDVQVTGA